MAAQLQADGVNVHSTPHGAASGLTPPEHWLDVTGQWPGAAVSSLAEGVNLDGCWSTCTRASVAGRAEQLEVRGVERQARGAIAAGEALVVVAVAAVEALRRHLKHVDPAAVRLDRLYEVDAAGFRHAHFVTNVEARRLLRDKAHLEQPLAARCEPKLPRRDRGQRRCCIAGGSGRRGASHVLHVQNVLGRIVDLLTRTHAAAAHLARRGRGRGAATAAEARVGVGALRLIACPLQHRFALDNLLHRGPVVREHGLYLRLVESDEPPLGLRTAACILFEQLDGVVGLDHEALGQIAHRHVFALCHRREEHVELASHRVAPEPAHLLQPRDRLQVWQGSRMGEHGD
eukprot:scaffold53079_cov70-Phaeocystis_antarctica.AAC.4